MADEQSRLRLKSLGCALLVVLTNVSGNFFLKRGMPAALSTPLDYITVIFRPWVGLGVILLILWMLARMALLSWADLSYVLPVTSIGYVLVAVTGRLLLQEQISGRRWGGIAFIVAGVMLVGGGSVPNSRPAKSHMAGAGK
jgi:drug/metabolite transporter (DMT)-like permease